MVWNKEKKICAFLDPEHIFPDQYPAICATWTAMLVYTSQPAQILVYLYSLECESVTKGKFSFQYRNPITGDAHRIAHALV